MKMVNLTNEKVGNTSEDLLHGKPACGGLL